MRNVKEVFLDRTCYKFLNKPVDLSVLKEVYDMAKLGPTSGNCCLLRIVLVQSLQEKEKLYKCLPESNIVKVKTAPVTALFAYDSKFYELMPKLFPTINQYKAILCHQRRLFLILLLGIQHYKLRIL
ncbi:MAG: nitroreductase family protein [Candidatus Rickettsia vulgarisii]